MIVTIGHALLEADQRFQAALDQAIAKGRERIEAVEAKAAAAQIRRMLEGDEPVPRPLINQLACCLYASGYASDFNQAKAIAAVFNSRPAVARDQV